MHNPLLEVRVAATRYLTPRIKELLLTAVDGAALPRYEPGAHIELHLESPSLGRFVRHYSIVGGVGHDNDHANTYRIAVQLEDGQRGSAHVHAALNEGSLLKISWPKNNFVLGRSDKHVLLLAGGIGITPIFSMLRSVLRRKQSFSFVYSGRTREGMAYASEALDLADTSGTLHLSGDPAVDHLDLKSIFACQPESTVVYVCGPAPMVAAAYKAAQSLGWEDSRVRSEQFGALRSNDDVAFEVELKRSGRVVEVGRNTSILDAITGQRIEMLSDCRRGECGLCPVPVVMSESPIDHRDRYLSEDEKAAGNTLCLCVSRIRGGRLVIDA